jgi:N-acetylglutamate synthase-like GNAT family acetyltransferase
MPNQMRYIKNEDIDRIVYLEKDTAHEPLTRKEIIQFRKKNNVSIVVCEDKQAVGFAIFKIFPKYLEIVRLAVDPLLRRKGIGSRIMNSIIQSQSNKDRDKIIVEVHQDYLGSHLFLKKFGFTAIQKKKNPEWYEFTYFLNQEEEKEEELCAQEQS